MAEAWSLALLEGGTSVPPFFMDRMLGLISYLVAATLRHGPEAVTS